MTSRLQTLLLLLHALPGLVLAPGFIDTHSHADTAEPSTITPRASCALEGSCPAPSLPEAGGADEEDGGASEYT